MLSVTCYSLLLAMHRSQVKGTLAAIIYLKDDGLHSFFKHMARTRTAFTKSTSAPLATRVEISLQLPDMAARCIAGLPSMAASTSWFQEQPQGSKILEICGVKSVLCS